MTRPSNPELLNDILQLRTEQGTGCPAEGLRLLINEAMLQNAPTRSKPFDTYERHRHPPRPRQRLQTPRPSPLGSVPSPCACPRCAAIWTSIPTRSRKRRPQRTGPQAGAGRNGMSRTFMRPARSLCHRRTEQRQALRSVPPRSAIAPPRWTPNSRPGVARPSEPFLIWSWMPATRKSPQAGRLPD